MQLKTEMVSQIPVYHIMQCTALSPHNSLACQNWHYWSTVIRKNITDFMPLHNFFFSDFLM